MPARIDQLLVRSSGQKELSMKKLALMLFALLLLVSLSEHSYSQTTERERSGMSLFGGMEKPRVCSKTFRVYARARITLQCR
jgi:hypothetical protein